jgi:Probable sensor domain DACNK/DisA bacterial checkpoint controller nucleotide-binding
MADDLADRVSRRRGRLLEELTESGFRLDGTDALRALVVEEIDRALRPAVHERRVPSTGTIVEPTTDSAQWSSVTELAIERTPLAGQPLPAARRFADGLSSWLLRCLDRDDEWLVFDRPAGSERDLVVLAEAFGSTVVQRHPTGAVRVAGRFGVLRWYGYSWHHEPPVPSWLDFVSACPVKGDPRVLAAMLEFAVHDLGAMGVGALLVYRPNGDPGPWVEERLPTPPPLGIRHTPHLAPLRHALTQIDGAAIFDGAGVLRQLGVRLVPTVEAEQTVDALGGTRHTSARRYSRDDPLACVMVVSEDGPVTVLWNGKVLGRSPS